MIDTQNEKIRISEMAIRGSLSHRSNSTMSIDDIISGIRSERNVLIKNKESKISKVSEMLTEDVFEIPLDWKWVALGDLCILLSRGKSPTYSDVKKYPVFAQKCNQPQHLALEKALFLDEATLEKWPEYFKLRDADVVINSTGTGTVGRVGYFTSKSLNPNYEFIVPDSHVTVVRVGNNVISKYIYYALRTKSIQTIMEKTFRGSTNQKEFYIDSVYSIPIPLPPTEEQKEIVGILDKVYEQLDIIDTLQQQYESDLSILKSKIIDAGIRGKLTKQLPEDGDAETLYLQIQKEKEKLIKEGRIKKEKPLSKIDADEISFEIPQSWKWVRISDTGLTVTGTTPPKANAENYNGDFPFFKPSDLDLGRHISVGSESLSVDGWKLSRQLKKGTILVCCIGTIGKCAIIDVDGTTNQQINALTPIICDSDYLLYAISSDSFQGQLQQKSRATTVTIIKKSKFDECLIPLPPIAEQKRIAKTIDELLQIIG